MHHLIKRGSKWGWHFTMVCCLLYKVPCWQNVLSTNKLVLFLSKCNQREHFKVLRILTRHNPFQGKKNYSEHFFKNSLKYQGNQLSKSDALQLSFCYPSVTALTKNQCCYVTSTPAETIHCPALHRIVKILKNVRKAWKHIEIILPQEMFG